MEFINAYLEKYSQKQDYYKKLGEYCEALCKKQLDENGIRSIVSSRVKPLKSLKNKVYYRNEVVGFKSIEDIEADIRDRVGVRIALYFPPDSGEVEKIIHALFDIVEEPARFENSSLAYDSRFSGYRAWHYKVKLKTDTFSETDPYDGEVIEIQIASMLMHAWAEVEHDLAYKAPEGGISDLEYALLSQLNGIVHTGEVILEQLKYAMEKRIEDNKRKFLNHYELASFIYKNLSQAKKAYINEPTLGRVDVLFNLLKKLDKHYPKAVMEYLDIIETQMKMDNHSISYQLIEIILSQNENNYNVYYDIISSIREPMVGAYSSDFETRYMHNENKINAFLSKWVELESFIRHYVSEESFDIKRINNRLQELLGENIGDVILDAYKIRNGIVHGIHVPETKKINQAIYNIDKILKTIKKLNMAINKPTKERKIV
ncbi:RelA/SpoT domain-containing protein [Serpentinicella sp. ANB-PHB4]|uniref:RelA/SpoT domain-containing protein n=1 Tax=Serpentinicella sp. ANB-PHB4 TaxID=3074076 RepID=UPI0028598207|nr:RelA/SpoT domain-containing protein [Serpentinicella sp. ANB-PHB4]MDR5659672.1 RelA/SpoT domain-containing protein [Serpentinicella sp. ANB-PHB4]